MSNFFEYMYSVNKASVSADKAVADEAADKPVKDAIVEALEEEEKVTEDDGKFDETKHPCEGKEI